MVAVVSSDVAMRSKSPIARGRYIELAERAARGTSSEAELRVILNHSVGWLELFHISALTWEYIHQQGIRSLDQLQARSNELDRHVRSAFPDVDVTDQGIRDALGELPTPIAWRFMTGPRSTGPRW